MLLVEVMLLEEMEEAWLLSAETIILLSVTPPSLGTLRAPEVISIN
jgi:hypothetical protein